MLTYSYDEIKHTRSLHEVFFYFLDGYVFDCAYCLNKVREGTRTSFLFLLCSTLFHQYYYFSN
mgnify:CR=1 FL=1